MIAEYEANGEKVFLLRRIIEIRIEKSIYEKLSRKYSKEEIIQYSDEKRVIHHTTKRNLYYISAQLGVPLLGHAAFGIIDRGTNLLQIRPITGCNLNCIFCSVDEGRGTRTKANDYIIDPDYLAEWYSKIAGFKGEGVEAHIDGQAEPLLYPYFTELVEKLRSFRETEVISVQTNGTLLGEKTIDSLEGKIDRVNLSISTLDEERARKIYGVRYPVEKVKNVAEMIANSKIDLLIAPVWVPRVNDEDIEKIIEFALDIGAGKKWPPLGIQKYIPYRGGRKLRHVMSFRTFYDRLRKWEEEYGVKLVLSPKDFGIEKRKRYPSEVKKGQVYTGKIIMDGRNFGEKIAVVKDRVVTVITDRPVGEHVKFRIIRSKDGIYLGEEI
ncbi:radical SAM protein [Geoglobus acetivorans]|uniref:Radical SAM domain protein n=1 Tax=Geoglobus acetivorans TaxID=565033 RepID=A0A0A7GBQ9_GEOAI|nr:radical SAM domain protein [Geoglobus acetivorans]